ncbi:MAG: PIN domain-containing protein [Thermoplasmata archaeon]
MTGSEILLDSWAWWEVLHDTATGRRIAQKFLTAPPERVHTSALTLGELAAKLMLEGDESRIDLMETAIRSVSRLHDVSPALAIEGGRLRGRLRRGERAASLADGIILATARHEGARIVSADRAFRGLPELMPL